MTSYMNFMIVLVILSAPSMSLPNNSSSAFGNTSNHTISSPSLSSTTSLPDSAKSSATTASKSFSYQGVVQRVDPFLYFLIPGIVIIILVGCAMRIKYRKGKPWAQKQSRFAQRRGRILRMRNLTKQFINEERNKSGGDFTNIAVISEAQ